MLVTFKSIPAPLLIDVAPDNSKRKIVGLSPFWSCNKASSQSYKLMLVVNF